jgi:hypothetical protein
MAQTRTMTKQTMANQAAEAMCDRIVEAVCDLPGVGWDQPVRAAVRQAMGLPADQEEGQ